MGVQWNFIMLQKNEICRKMYVSGKYNIKGGDPDPKRQKLHALI